MPHTQVHKKQVRCSVQSAGVATDHPRKEEHAPNDTRSFKESISGRPKHLAYQDLVFRREEIDRNNTNTIAQFVICLCRLFHITVCKMCNHNACMHLEGCHVDYASLKCSDHKNSNVSIQGIEPLYIPSEVHRL